MVAGISPYYKKASKSNDNLYKDFVDKNVRFWDRHRNYRPGKNYTDAFRDLINLMMKENPAERATIEDIKNHPWYTNESMFSGEQI
jgi:serine/threonine protein kinase